jgi:hypothetical protein
MVEIALGLGVVAMVAMLCMSAYLMGQWIRRRRPFWILVNGLGMCFLIQALNDVAHLFVQYVR